MNHKELSNISQYVWNFWAFFAAFLSFFATVSDCFEQHGISYYHQRKARKLGVKLGLWKYEAKFNPKFPKSVINKTSHYIINWDVVIKFFGMPNNEFPLTILYSRFGSGSI